MTDWMPRSFQYPNLGAGQPPSRFMLSCNIGGGKFICGCFRHGFCVWSLSCDPICLFFCPVSCVTARHYLELHTYTCLHSRALSRPGLPGIFRRFLEDRRGTRSVKQGGKKVEERVKCRWFGCTVCVLGGGCKIVISSPFPSAFSYLRHSFHSP